MYEIKVLDSNEFDEVAKSDPRYSYVDDSNMGFADRQKGVAYVRGTHIHDLNKYLINHELEELEEDESTHEDPNGIRHKKFLKEFLLPMMTAGFVSGGRTGGLINLGADPTRDSKFQLLGPLGAYGLNPQNNVGGYGTPKATVSKGDQGLQMSPFNFFGTGSNTFTGTGETGGASPRISQTVTGGIQSGLNQGQGFEGIQGLPLDLLQRLKGAPAGRISF